MTIAHFLLLFATYKYFVIFPMAVLEGHIISLIVGFLGRLDYLNPFIAGTVIMSGNLTGDVILYWIGYHKGEAFLKRWGKYFGITHKSIAKSKALFQTHHSTILLVAKLTNGFGLIMPILFTAGLARVPFRVYLFWNIVGEFLWTVALVTLGYFLGNLYTHVEGAIFKVGIVGFAFFGVLILLQIYRTVTTRYMPGTTSKE